MEERAVAATRWPRAGFGPISPRVALVILGAVVVAVALSAGSSALGPFIVGLVLASLLDIPVERMARIGIPRWISVLVVYAITVYLLDHGLRFTLPPLAGEVRRLISQS